MSEKTRTKASNQIRGLVYLVDVNYGVDPTFDDCYRGKRPNSSLTRFIAAPYHASWSSIPLSSGSSRGSDTLPSSEIASDTNGMFTWKRHHGIRERQLECLLVFLYVVFFFLLPIIHTYDDG